MILADKIISLRKKAGWSQEELAAQLNVSRQSVSKWEGAQSVPDMERILQMSRLFGVSTDFLLKDELEAPETAPLPDRTDSPLRRVSMEEAAAYLTLSWQNAPRVALATLLCILSPIVLLLLGGVSRLPGAPLREEAAIGVGLAYWLVVVAGYLAWSILTDSWEHSWAVWPVAGILYGAVVSLLHLLDAAGRRGVRRDV